MQKRQYWFIFCFLAAFGLFNTCKDGSNISSNKPITEINGFQYIYHIQNKGATPQASEYAYYHYTMSADDSLINNSRDLNLISKMQIPPAALEGRKPKRPNPILTGLKTMCIGDSITIKIPLDSVPHVPPGFDKYKFLNYDIVMADIKTYEEVLAEDREAAQKLEAQIKVDAARESDVEAFLKQVIKDFQSGKLDDQIIETSSGIKYFIHEEGAGKKPKVNNPIKVHYYGILPDGTQFDNSFKRGTPHFFTLGAGQVIKAWDEAIGLMNIGSKATLFIPPHLAYGEKGSPPTIPPNAELIFYVEILHPYN